MANFPDLKTLFIDNHESILPVGEGNFTFSTALAAMRGGWNGIISTTMEKKVPCLEYARNIALNAVVKNNGTQQDITAIQNAINSLPDDESREWISDIDATNNLAQFRDHRNIKNIWFQCPWSRICSPDLLLKDFVAHCSTFQQPGDLLMIGIVYKDENNYYRKYDLWSFLGLTNDELDELMGYSEKKADSSVVFNKKDPIIKKYDYDLLYVDDNLINDILLHGYQHEGCYKSSQLHDSFRNKHKTIVLKKIAGEEDITKHFADLKVFDKADDSVKNDDSNKQTCTAPETNSVSYTTNILSGFLLQLDLKTILSTPMFLTATLFLV